MQVNNIRGDRPKCLLQAVANAPLPPRMSLAERVIHGTPALVCGTGYTGEDGVEFTNTEITQMAKDLGWPDMNVPPIRVSRLIQAGMSEYPPGEHS